MSLSRPLIGIAMDVTEPRAGRLRAECGLAYAERVAEAGGEPVFLPPLPRQVPWMIERLAGFILTGGDDPRMECYGQATDPRASPVHPQRQRFEMELLVRLLERPEIPVLGICLGMQMLALQTGGQMDQYLPDSLPTVARHRNNSLHPVVPVGEHWLTPGQVTSSHKQAIVEVGPMMRVVAKSDDGVIEAIERRDSRFCIGVQWHPERTEDASLGLGLFHRLVEAASAYEMERASGRG